jgi:predicted DNA-binding transcriptional regulator YafY
VVDPVPEQLPLLRQWTLLRTLSARRQEATLRELGDDAGVSSKTVLRDLDLLRQLAKAVAALVLDFPVI